MAEVLMAISTQLFHRKSTSAFRGSRHLTRSFPLCLRSTVTRRVSVESWDADEWLVEGVKCFLWERERPVSNENVWLFVCRWNGCWVSGAYEWWSRYAVRSADCKVGSSIACIVAVASRDFSVGTLYFWLHILMVILFYAMLR